MKASELIKHLKQMIKEHGDLPVRYYDSSFETDVEMVEAYNEVGNDPDAKLPAVEIFLH